jgi:hypothetical protein
MSWRRRAPPNRKARSFNVVGLRILRPALGRCKDCRRERRESRQGDARAVEYVQRDWVYTPPIQTETRHSDEESLGGRTNVGLSPAAAPGQCGTVGTQLLRVL